MKKKTLFIRKNRIRRLELQFWLRVFSTIVDFYVIRYMVLPFIEIVFQIQVLFPTLSILPKLFSPFLILQNYIQFFILYLISYILIGFLCEWSPLQGTPGKLFVRLKVCNFRSERIRFSRALLRNILKPISILSVIGIFSIDISRKRQALHDIMAGTIVKRRY